MIKILASSFNHYHKDNGKNVANKFDNSNGIVDQIKSSLKNNGTILFIPTDINDSSKIDMYSKLLFDGLRLSGITFSNYLVLTKDNMCNIQDYIDISDMIFLSGGNTYSQKKLFDSICLKECLENFDGLVVGQSAGAINMASNVFNSPENLDESDPVFFTGLGLCDINIEPHFVNNFSGLDKFQQYQVDAILSESFNRKIYGQCNGSHIFVDDDDSAMIYGETYLISDGVVSLICKNGECKKIDTSKVKK